MRVATGQDGQTGSAIGTYGMAKPLFPYHFMEYIMSESPVISFVLTVNDSGSERFHRPLLASVFYLLARKAAVTNYLLLFSSVMTPPPV